MCGSEGVKTDLPDHFRFNFVQVVTEPCGSVVLL